MRICISAPHMGNIEHVQYQAYAWALPLSSKVSNEFKKSTPWRDSFNAWPCEGADGALMVANCGASSHVFRQHRNRESYSSYIHGTGKLRQFSKRMAGSDQVCAPADRADDQQPAQC